ncbi:hypothetical protein GRI55_09530 [Erythrobacter citreus]|uniref:Uncharacterized protein n=1 Tax=Qipengyuania citrea TaxID=225971 RepID=A0A6I4UFE4_9SPHN|nr:hypothetical protein [Qipengyuania citrea]MDQ0564972.1 hypothetical protein [Qipengyuania citrea]MXP36013.1 hypothetical protein [Qipengyuania citrea]
MAENGARHPRIISSLTIVRNRSEFARQSAIRSIALFTAQVCPDYNARFHLEHSAFDSETSRAEIIQGIVERVPQRATLISRAPPMMRHYLHHRSADGSPASPTDLQLLQRHRSDLHVVPLECASDTLDETAAAFDIRRAGPGSSTLAQARKAADEAQLLYLTYLWAFVRPSQRISFSAAWQAWREIERARPMPF